VSGVCLILPKSKIWPLHRERANGDVCTTHWQHVVMEETPALVMERLCATMESYGYGSNAGKVFIPDADGPYLKVLLPAGTIGVTSRNSIRMLS
jgi:hypothetical protein